MKLLLTIFTCTAVFYSAFGASVPDPATENVERMPAEKAKAYFEFQEWKDSTLSSGLFQKLQQTYGNPPGGYTRTEITNIEKAAAGNGRLVTKPVDHSRTPANQLPDSRTDAQVREHFDALKKLHPNPPGKLPDIPSSADALAAMGDAKLAAFSDAQVEQLLDTKGMTDQLSQAQMTTLTKGRYLALVRTVGLQAWYEAQEIADAETNGMKQTATPKVTPDTQMAAQIAKAEKIAEFKDKSNVPPGHWLMPEVRHDWTDVLPGEDPSQDLASTKKVTDLVGATFSYSQDNKAHTETWTTVGALIWPWVWKNPHPFAGGLGGPEESSPFVPSSITLAPSYTLDRISTNGSPTGEVDQVIHRVGFYGDWVDGLHDNPLWDIQARIAGVYATDTSYRASMPGFEADIEPTIRLGQVNGETWWFGGKDVVIPKATRVKGDSDNSVVDFQLRAWLHMEGGDVQNSGSTWVATPGSFFRMGPTTQLRFNINGPYDWQPYFKSFSLTAQYTCLSDLQGPKGHDNLFSATAAWTINQDATTGQKLSLTATYTKGGIIYIKQDVDTFMIGLIERCKSSGVWHA